MKNYFPARSTGSWTPGACPTKREKANLDIFWQKDEAVEESANLPALTIIADDIVADLEGALEQFAGIKEELKH